MPSPAHLIKRLNWKVLRPLGHALGGHERSLVFGPGAELEELREYRPGDDVRAMDWNVLARTGQPYIRHARQDRALDVWLLIDVSPSFNWGTAQMLKRDRALEFAYVAAGMLAHFGNRVGALLFSHRPLRFMPLGTGRKHLSRLVDAITDSATAQRDHAGTTDLAAGLHRAFAAIDRKALVFVLSDFITTAPNNWPKKLRKLAEKHEVVAVHIHDPRERELPDTGMMTFEDPETGQQFVVNTRDAKLRARYKQAALQQAERIRQSVVGSGAAYFSLSTADDLFNTMLHFLESRRRRIGGR
jgi:uncharacterized protein (DUF58 family)